MRKNDIFSFLFFLALIFFVFRSLILLPEIIGGDWPYLFPEMLRDPSIYFSSWNPGAGNGLGGVNSLYFLSVFLGFTVFLAHTFSIPWVFIYKFFWFILPLFFGILSGIYLIKTIFPQSALWQKLLASFIYTVNTYFLMIVGGGQMGIALAYSIAPLVLARFIKVTDVILSSSRNIKYQISNIKYAIIAGLILAAQVMFDPRIAYLTMIAVVIYLVLSIKRGMLNILFLLLYSIAVPIGIAILLHAVWILPILFFQSSLIQQELTSVAGFRFFSFADFSHAFSLLHPNWPENIFGKTYFMKAEFISLPIIAYSSLLFLSSITRKNAEHNAEKRRIIFLVLLGLVGAFLAKGASEPFGFINLWVFEHIPGFAMFRDPTKFYVLIALSYSVLIPFSVYSLYKWLKSKIQSKYKIFNFSYVFLIFTILYLIFLIRPAIFGQLGGTFREREVPLEYIKLKDFLHSQPDFFRILWIPRQHRFTYYSLTHLPVEAEPLFKKAKIVDIINQLRKPGTEEYLSELGVKYIIVPYDPNGEIFVKDRRYDEIAYLKAIEQLEHISWLVKLRQFKKIAVFEAKSSPRDHFWLEGKGKITYFTDDITHYSINVEIDSPQRLIFSENFNPKWQLMLRDKVINAKKTDEGLNSFLLSKGNYQGNIVFFGDKYYVYGKIISLGTVVLIVVFLFAIYRKRVYNT